MNKMTQTNWFVGTVSVIPGLGIFLLGRKRMGLGIFFAVGLLFAIFGVFPNFVTWFIFGLAYVAQIAYAVGHATIQTTRTEITPNSNLSHPLPDRFRDKKSIASEVKKSLSTILGSDEHLMTAIVGLEKGTSQFLLIGVTQDHLVISQCSNTGNPSNPKRILKDDVSWVNLKIGERNLLLTIEYENDQKIDLHILGKLREQSKLIVDEFPGTWSNEKFMEGVSSYKKESNRLGTNIFYVACIVFMFVMIFLTDGLEQTHKQMAIYLTASFVFFMMGWPQFIIFVRRLKREPGITSANAIASLSMLSVLLFWLFALFMACTFSIAFVQFLQNAG